MRNNFTTSLSPCVVEPFSPYSSVARTSCCTTMTKEDKAKSPKRQKTSKEIKIKEGETDAVPYAVRMKAVTVISKPMANEKKV